MRNGVNVALLSFMEFNDAVLLAFFDACFNALTGNPHFANAAFLLPTLVAAKEDYATTLANAKDGSPMQAAEKMQLKLPYLTACGTCAVW